MSGHEDQSLLACFPLYNAQAWNNTTPRACYLGQNAATLHRSVFTIWLFGEMHGSMADAAFSGLTAGFTARAAQARDY